MRSINLIFFIIIFFSSIKTYQAPEHGIFLINKIKQCPLVASVPKKTEWCMVKREDGGDSKVFFVENLTKFLSLALQENLPLILCFYFGKNDFTFLYQKVADYFTGKAIFLSVNLANASPLSKLFLSFLRFERILNSDISKFPIFVFSKKGAITFKDQNIILTRGSFKLMSDRNDISEEILRVRISKELVSPSVPVSDNLSFIQKLKNWIKAKVYD